MDRSGSPVPVRRPDLRTWWRRGALGVALVAVVVAIVLVSSGGPSPRPAIAPVSPTYWGAEIGPQFTGQAAPWDMKALTAFQSALGRAPGVVAFNLPFENCVQGTCTDESFPSQQATELRAYGAIPFLNWSSQSSPLSTDQPAFRLAAVADGSFDKYIRQFALEVRAWGHPFFLRFDWEMNQSWFPWGESANGNRPGDFVRAWRHVHSIFTSVGATNATWVWCPYVSEAPSPVALRELYPGNNYVDWTCLDGYNFGAAAGGSSSWESFRRLFTPSYRAITAQVAPSKPMIVGEVASAEAGGSKPQWIRDMLAEIPIRFPRIRGVVWFDAENAQAGSRDATLPLESSRASMRAFAAGVGDSHYRGNSFGGLSETPIAPPGG